VGTHPVTHRAGEGRTREEPDNRDNAQQDHLRPQRVAKQDAARRAPAKHVPADEGQAEHDPEGQLRSTDGGRDHGVPDSDGRSVVS
jgi:hypothetical protein